MWQSDKHAGHYLFVKVVRKALKRSVLLVPIAILMAHQPDKAEAETPICNQQAAGTVACFERKLCSCGFERGGSMTGLAPGYRWDCGVLRPTCEQGGHPTTLSSEALLYRPGDVIVDDRGRDRRVFEQQPKPKPF